MLVTFVCFEMHIELYSRIMEVGVLAGVGFLVVGTITFFLHNPYRMEQKKVRAAEADLKSLEKIAKKNVRKNEKIRIKEENRQAKEHMAGIFRKRAQWNEIEDVQENTQNEAAVEEQSNENIIPMKEKKNA